MNAKKRLGSAALILQRRQHLVYLAQPRPCQVNRCTNPSNVSAGAAFTQCQVNRRYQKGRDFSCKARGAMAWALTLHRSAGSLLGVLNGPLAEGVPAASALQLLLHLLPRCRQARTKQCLRRCKWNKTNYFLRKHVWIHTHTHTVLSAPNLLRLSLKVQTAQIVSECVFCYFLCFFFGLTLRIQVQPATVTQKVVYSVKKLRSASKKDK